MHSNLQDTDLQDADLRGADLTLSNLRRADLTLSKLWGADLRGADLYDTIGNGREIKSTQVNSENIAWMQDAQGLTMLQIGCERHSLQTWQDADDDAIDPDALEWWTHHPAVILMLVDSNPSYPPRRDRILPYLREALSLSFLRLKSSG
jgi:Uncharacterized low-complexity proteins